MEPEAIPTDRTAPPADREDELDCQLVAAIAALLHRYGDRSQVVVGHASSSEPPFRIPIQLTGETTFAELLERVRTALSDRGAADSDAPPADVVVAVDTDPADGNPLEEPWLCARNRADGLVLELHGNSAALGAVGGDALVEHLRTLLASALEAQHKPIAALSLLSQSEHQKLLLDFNDTAALYPSACLHELIAQQAQSTPEVVAVELGEERLTYAELEARASQLAHHLIDLGVKPEVLVGICTKRSLEMVVGLLGILKAGGAYVPIDPAYPADRQEYMLTQSQAPVIVTQESLVDSIPAGSAQIVRLDSDWPEIAQQPTVPAGIAADPEQLAYVIYTSGSTGKPKGVQISHRALVNFLTTMRKTPGLTPQDVLVAVTTLSFDIAGLELYLPLTTGARVVIAPAETSEDPRLLAELLERTQASVMQATPTTWRMLIDGGWPGRAEMKALCGGEALPVALADRLVEAGLELWNMYGPTETTIWSTCAQIQTRGETLSIGRPIANTTLYILDALMAPVPVGVAGELWIGGDGLARGYRGRPDLTDERFVAHPFDQTPGARIYRTGDMARYRGDGTVEFLGRIDHQVKVRGFRIELGEIETVLARHPEVVDAVVVARGSDAEAELAAYVTVSGEGGAPAHELRRHLGQTLPAYMVPATVTTLDAFPLTPNGKVDRKALPEPVRERSSEHRLIAPRTSMEQQLATIWQRELGIEQIGVSDNFFDLGVSSIVAATLFAAIERDLGDSLPLGAIFRAPTIETLAKLIESDDGPSRWTSLVPIQPLGSRPPIYCIHGGAGTILHLQRIARRLGAEQPFYGLQSSGLYGGSAPIKTVQGMASHYLSEMRQVHPGGPWLLAGYCFGAIVAFEIAQQLVASGEDVQLLATFNGPSPLWVKRWAYYGNQPSWRAKRSLAPMPPKHVRRARRGVRRLQASVKMVAHIPRAVVEPHRLANALRWYTRKPRTQLLLSLGRPVPERDREEFFLDLHNSAERRYVPTPYAGEILVFYGDGLYEDPMLGWESLGTVLSHAVPGEHVHNRQLMHEPSVSFIAERLQQYLEHVAEHAG